VIEKSNDQVSFRVPDELKKKFDALAKAEGKTTSAVLIAFVEGYVREREEYVASIASMFGYERTQYKEKRRTTSSNNARRSDG
jgi:predicted DNA-binding protein